MSFLSAWLISAFVLLVGCWLQTAIGFGMAVVAAPFIVLVKPEWVPVALTVTALPLSSINAWNQRDALRYRSMLIPMVTRLGGTALGVWVLLHMNVFWLQVAVAASVLIAVVISVRSVHFEATPSRLGWAGLIGGFMGTTTSIGGPPMAIVMQHGEPRTVRANLSLYFAYSCLVSILSYIAAGILTWRLFLESISFLPCVFVGFFFGIKARKYMDGDKYRPVLLGICTFAAVLALAGAIWRFNH